MGSNNIKAQGLEATGPQIPKHLQAKTSLVRDLEGQSQTQLLYWAYV